MSALAVGMMRGGLYVDWKDPIAVVRLLSDWEGALNAELEVRVPPPVLPRTWRGGRSDADDPTGDRVILGRTTLRIRMTGVPVAAPGVDAEPEQITDAARRLVTEVCRSINSAAAEPLADLSQLWTPAAHPQTSVDAPQRAWECTPPLKRVGIVWGDR